MAFLKGKLTVDCIKKVLIPNRGHFAHFVHRRVMDSPHPLKKFRHHLGVVPATALPVDSTGNAAVSCPMDGNDNLGDCGEAMACHGDNIFTFGQGKAGWKESIFDLTTLEAQYKQVSGGDNGLSEDDVVNRIWKVGIAGNAQAIITDALDIDITNTVLAQFAIDNFYLACMGWSVPDAFINGFNTGTVWPSAGIPDPNNGHFTVLADVGGPNDSASGVSLNGFYRNWTWGSWCWCGPAFIASVQPQCFIVFSPRQFNAQGYDSKGRHITKQAALWAQCGGNPIPQAVINAFPPPGGPPIPPGPTPPGPVPPGPVTPPAGPTAAAVQAAVDAAIVVGLKAAYANFHFPFASVANVINEANAQCQPLVNAAIASAFGNTQGKLEVPFWEK